MLRVPQHERKIINDFKSVPIILSHVEGLRERFSADREFSMRGYVKYCLVLLVLYSFGLGRVVYAQGEPFYKGKTINIVVGYNPGDAHDLWARAYARYMGRYIPGNPNLLVRNMPGGGTMIAANYVYGVAEADGTTLGSIFPTLYFAQLTGRKEVKFDWAKFTWIGSPEHNGSVFYARADRYKTLDDMRKAAEPAKCSTTAVGTSSHYIPKLIEETLGIRLTVVTGYPGGAEQDLALERGEVQCRAVASSTFFGREPYFSWLKKGFVRLLLQTSRKRDAKMPDVPTLFELMDKEKTPARSRLLANVMLDAGGFGPYPIVAAPGVPTERIKILREAYGQTLKTPEFLEEAKKNKWEIKPVGGDELDALAKEVAKPSTEVIERLKSLLGD
jgi:tripartite-type tricarboxylate transporter receptor subunit TctC